MYRIQALSLLRKAIPQSKTSPIYQKRFIQLQPTKATVSLEATETFEQKNERLNRPLSPHLSIYQPQLTTILSITHRATGLALVGYCLGLGICWLYSTTIWDIK